MIMKKAMMVSLLALSGVCHAGGGGGYGGVPSLAEPFMHVNECLDKHGREIGGTVEQKKAGRCEIVGVEAIDKKNAEFVKR